MKNKRFEIFIIAFMVAFSLIIYGFYLVFNKIATSNHIVMFVRPYTILSCDKKICENVSDNKEEYNSKDYETYIKNIYSGYNQIYYYSNNDEFYVNSNDKNIFKNDTTLIGFNKNAKVNVIDFETDSINNYELNVLSEKLNIDLDNYILFYPEKITLDFDNDGELETLYIINSSEESPSYLSLLAYENNGKIKILDKDETDSYIDKVYYDVYYVLDMFKDKKIDFVLTKIYYDNIGSCSVVYKLNNKKYYNMNECVIIDG